VSHARLALVLGLVGFGFGGAQQLLLREFTALLYGEEVVLLLVAAVALAAASLGYRLGDRLRPATHARLLLLALVVQFAWPAAPRWLTAGLCWLRGGTGPEHLASLVVFALVLVSPFAVFLPALLTAEADPARRLLAVRRGYAAELAGFFLGSAAATALGTRPELRLAVHFAALVGLAALTLGRARALACAGLATLALALAPPLAAAGLDAVYQHKHRLPGARVLASLDSPYQRVEVVDSPRRGRALHLDGLRDLDGGELDILNHYLGRVPARLHRLERALVLGNGTLSLVPELADRARELHSVELDPVVVGLGLRWFTDRSAVPFGSPRWFLHYADGKAFLAATDLRFDLIVVDLPSPLTFGEAYLHTREFYALCRAHLTPTGVLAVQLSGPLGNPARTPARLAASLAAVFDDVVVLGSELADRSFAYASDALPFTADALRAAAHPRETNLQIVEGEALAAAIAGAAPITLDDLDLVLRRGLERLLDRHID
jgi:spermidine synthase